MNLIAGQSDLAQVCSPATPTGGYRGPVGRVLSDRHAVARPGIGGTTRQEGRPTVQPADFAAGDPAVSAGHGHIPAQLHL